MMTGNRIDWNRNNAKFSEVYPGFRHELNTLLYKINMSLAPGTASLFVRPFSTNGIQAFVSIKRGPALHKGHSSTLFEEACS